MPHRPLRRPSSRLAIFVPWVVLLAAPLAAATEPAPRPVTISAPDTLPALPIADYGRWRSIAQETISSDGRRVAWVYRQLRRDDVLHLRDLETDDTREVARGSGPRFSPDARWLAYFVAPPIAEAERLEQADERVPRSVELLEIATGRTWSWSDAAAFEFSPGSDRLLVRKARREGHPRDRGDDLVVRELARGTDELLSAVGEYAFDPDGTRLAFTTRTADGEGNGLQVLETSTGARRVLDGEPVEYARLTWSDDGGTLAVLRGDTPEGFEQRENTLVVASELDAEEPRLLELPPFEIEGLVPSELASLAFGDTGDRLFLGLKEQEPEADEPPDGVRWPDVHVFHWDDDRIQTVQQARAAADRRRTWRAVVHLPSMRLVRLTDDRMAEADETADGRWAVGRDDRDYLSDWAESSADYYRVDTDTGERDLIVEAQGRTLGLSPLSTHFLYWRDGQVHAYEFATGTATNLTASAPVSFVDQEFDRFGTPPPYGVAGWTADGTGVILEHRHDLWLQPLDGSPAVDLTGGVGDARQIRLRVVQLDPDATTIDLSRPLLLHAFGSRDRGAGYFVLHDGELTELVYEDRWFGSLAKAADAERLLFTQETFREFPDLHVSGPRFEDRRRITDANPQQAEYRWGERMLFEFEGPDGVRLQGTLIVPDGRAPGERLPMLVNFYEQNSQNLHRYQAPQHVHRPNFSGYASNGYLVMQPDIHFRTRTTHTDMLESVEGAVREVVAMGYADPERVGLNGHSFSGGGSAFIAGRSNMFAAIVAGAAPINLRSEFNVLFRGSGQNNHGYDIHGQGRYGTDPYTDLELYLDQSPITHVPTMDTPMIYLHGEDDQVVEYLQGMELYNAARFLGKPVIFLSYPGEGHGLSRLENRLDFQIRIRQFYDHHLKGTPAPRWMTDGVPYLERDRHRVVPDSLLGGRR